MVTLRIAQYGGAFATKVSYILQQAVNAAPQAPPQRHWAQRPETLLDQRLYRPPGRPRQWLAVPLKSEPGPFVWPLFELDGLPALISALEAEQKKATEALADGSLYAIDNARAMKLATRSAQIDQNARQTPSFRAGKDSADTVGVL